jgi:cobalt-zinc-cadmium efflux system membrane fusion protein
MTMTMETAASRMGIDARLFVKRSIWTLAIALVLGGCGGSEPAIGPAALEPYVVTHTSGPTELFVEFRPLVAGQPSVFAAHFTQLADYKPVTEGTVDVVLSGGSAPTERFRVRAPRAPGIFAPTVVPRGVGERELSLVLDAPGLSVTHELGTITVFGDLAAAHAAGSPEAAEGEIGFLKEQQWITEFAVEEVAPGDIRDSVRAPARLRAAANREYLLSAPVSGLVRAEGELPTLGSTVAKDQVLAVLVPRLGVGVDRAVLQTELATAQAEASLAESELERVRRLFSDQAVAQRRVDEAQAAQRSAAARLGAARQRQAQSGGQAGGIALRAPLAGVLAQVHVGNGAAVSEGDPLFHIVDRSEIWLEAQVSESDVARLSVPTGASFELPGVASPIEIDIASNGHLVGVGSVLDPQSRSLPVIFALRDPPSNLVLNQAVQANILTGQSRPALSVPASALIDDGGQRVVYVMRSGESFSRVPVKVGIRDGERFEIVEGLKAGERVVARGAMQIRLAAATPEAMGHGHAH